jgi:hypothetical protein
MEAGPNKALACQCRNHSAGPAAGEEGGGFRGILLSRGTHGTTLLVGEQGQDVTYRIELRTQRAPGIPPYTVSVVPGLR